MTTRQLPFCPRIPKTNEGCYTGSVLLGQSSLPCTAASRSLASISPAKHTKEEMYLFKQVPGPCVRVCVWHHGPACKLRLMLLLLSWTLYCSSKCHVHLLNCSRTPRVCTECVSADTCIQPSGRSVQSARCVLVFYPRGCADLGGINDDGCDDESDRRLPLLRGLPLMIISCCSSNRFLCQLEVWVRPERGC